MSGRRFTAAIAAVGALSLCATMAFAGAPDAYADTYSSTVVASASTTTSGTIPAGQLSVVNFNPKWGDKQSNKTAMLKYIEEAHQEGVKMIVFPEMALTGYVSSSDPESDAYRMAVSQAETTESPVTRELAEAAERNGMWVIYGTPEKIPGDTGHAYNSAFAISPDGKVSAYQKIAPVEGSWATPGSTPVILQTEWGMIGLSICYDTYAQPEIERYYAAQGVGLLINPTATSRSYTDIDGDGAKDAKGWEWYYRNRLESIASRDGLTIASADLVGNDGNADADGRQPYDFPGGSVILQGGFSSCKYYAGLNSDGTILTAKEGSLTNDADLKVSVGSTTKVENDFHPDYYAKWYAELADKQESGQTLSYRYGSKDAPTTAVANVSGVWGDKDANTDMMLKYIDEAYSKGVDVIVFPETILTGYDSTEPKGKDDAHTSDPELARYYAASGAELLLHPTATTGNAWYRESRMGSYTDRDGLAVVTDNVWGPDGYPLDADGEPIYSVDDNGDTISSGKDVAGYNYMGVGHDPFRTSSLIIDSWNDKNGTVFDYATGSAIDTSGTGKGASETESADMTFAEGAYDPDNLEYRSMDLRSSGFRVENFNARLYSKMYDQLAKRFISGYRSMYPEASALDKSMLAAPLSQAKAKLAESGKYTDDTTMTLTEAYEEALSLQNNTTFSSEQNGLVTTAAEQLGTAIDGLKVKATDKAADTPSTSVTAKKQSVSPDGEKAATAPDTTARTGSDVMALAVALTLLAGAGTAAGAYARRKTARSAR